MQTAQNMDELLARARQVSAKVRRDRERAVTSAMVMIRTLEARIHDALEGDTLRGMKSLIPGEMPYYGANLSGHKVNIDKYLPEDGREVLILDKHGKFYMAHGVFPWRVEVRPVEDEDVRATDLDHISRAIQEVLGRHIVRSERTAASYRAVEELSDRLANAIGLRM